MDEEQEHWGTKKGGGGGGHLFSLCPVFIVQRTSRADAIREENTL